MKILVTGCAGFIGTNLCKRLLEKGHDVIGVDNFSFGYQSNMKEIGLKNYFCTDVRHLCDLPQTDVVFHQANLRKNISSQIPIDDINTTVIGTKNVLDYAVKAGVKKFIYASSSLAYGEHTGAVTEHNKLNPICMYGISKVGAEKMVGMYSRKIPTIIFRYFQGYGPYQDTQRGAAIIPTVIKNVLRQEPITIYGDGRQTRSFTWIEDIVDILESSLTNDLMLGQIFNVCSGVEYSINEIVHKILECCKALGIEINSNIRFEKARKDDVLSLKGDNRKIMSFGRFNHNINGNLKKTIEFYKKHL